MRIVQDRRYLKLPKHLSIRVYDTDSSDAQSTKQDTSLPAFNPVDTSEDSYRVVSSRTMQEPVRYSTYLLTKFVYDILEKFINKQAAMSSYPVCKTAMFLAGFTAKSADSLNSPNSAGDTKGLNALSALLDSSIGESIPPSFDFTGATTGLRRLVDKAFFGRPRGGLMKVVGDRIRADAINSIAQQLAALETVKLIGDIADEKGNKTIGTLLKASPAAWWLLSAIYNRYRV